MARERNTRKRSKVERRTIALNACALRNFDPSVPLPEGVVCGIFSQETIKGPGGIIVRQVSEAVIAEP